MSEPNQDTTFVSYLCLIRNISVIGILFLGIMAISGPTYDIYVPKSIYNNAPVSEAEKITLRNDLELNISNRPISEIIRQFKSLGMPYDIGLASLLAQHREQAEIRTWLYSSDDFHEWGKNPLNSKAYNKVMELHQTVDLKMKTGFELGAIFLILFFLTLTLLIQILRMRNKKKPF